MPFTPEQLKEHRAKLKKAGICIVCHKNKARKSRATCVECAKLNKANCATRYKKRIGDGVCANCGGYKDDPSLTVCINCSDYIVARRNENNQRKRILG